MLYFFDVIWLFVILFMIVLISFMVIKKKISKPQLSIFSNKKAVSSLMVGLCGKLGVGALVGVPLAIYIGGYGVILWIFLSGVIGSFVIYLESKLAIKYYGKTENKLIGGAYYYLEKTDKPFLPKIMAYLVFLSYIIMFPVIQTSTMVDSVLLMSELNRLVCLLVIVSLVYIVIIFGEKSIIRMCNLLVPIVCVIYLVITMYVFFTNISSVILYIKQIIVDSINYESFFTGSIFSYILIGFKRGMFASEAGLGTVFFSLSVSDRTEDSAFLSSLGVIYTSIVIAFLTGFLVYTANPVFSEYDSLYNEAKLNGIEILNYSLKEHYNSSITIVLIGLVLVFGISNIIVAYFYGLQVLRYLKKNEHVFLYLFIGLIVLSSFIRFNKLLVISDFLISLTVGFNVLGMIWMIIKNKV